MEWYFGSDGGNLIVPKEQETLDCWLQWGMTKSGRSGSQKDDLFYATNSTEEEELNFSRKNFANEVGADQMDDIFLSSLLEDELDTTDTLLGSFSFSPESEKTMISESQYVPCNRYGTGSTKHLKKHAFSPSMGWEERYNPSSCQQVEVPMVNTSMPSNQDSFQGYVGDEGSLGENILLELGRVTAQFPESTRICFRDAFYRLAENTKLKEQQNENGNTFENKPLSTIDDDTYRFGKQEATESKTNVLDRAIAELLFNKMDLATSDHPSEHM